jgi:hypothetical protein
VNTLGIDDARMEDWKNGTLERVEYSGKFSDLSSRFTDKECGQQ